MDVQTDLRLSIGGNQPPDLLVDEANERIAAANRWLIERDDVSAWDDDIADKAGGFKSQTAATRKALDDRRLEEGRVFKTQQEKLYSEPLNLLQMALNAIDGKIRTYLKAKQARLDAERVEREAEARRIQQEALKAQQAAEEAAKQQGADMLRAMHAAQAAARQAEEAAEAAAKPAQSAVIKGTFTQRALSLRTYWCARITDRGLAMRAYKAHPILLKAIDDALLNIATAEAKIFKDATKAPKGCEFYSEER